MARTWWQDAVIYQIYVRSERGGAWVHDPHTDEWYLANFSPAQPELDWSNPEVRAAMAEVVEFWNGHGVDGYRVDMVDHLGKDPDLRDDEPGEDLHPRDRIAAARHQLDTARSGTLRVVDGPSESVLAYSASTSPGTSSSRPTSLTAPRTSGQSTASCCSTATTMGAGRCPRG